MGGHVSNRHCTERWFISLKLSGTCYYHLLQNTKTIYSALRVYLCASYAFKAMVVFLNSIKLVGLRSGDIECFLWGTN
jgi:hypothetical protein